MVIKKFEVGMVFESKEDGKYELIKRIARNVYTIKFYNTQNEVDVNHNILNTDSIKDMIGKKFETINYGSYTIIDRDVDKRYYIIQFDNGYIKKAIIAQIKKGAIKNPYYPSMCGVGYIGTKYVKGHFLYNRWRNMLNRCYNKNDKSYKFYGGKGIVVCDRWYSFENYVEDCLTLKGYDEEKVKSGELHLDKDLINRDALIYSPETCCWIMKKENMKEKILRVYKRKFIAIRISDGYTEEYNSINEFCDKWGSKYRQGVSECLSGKRETTHGWGFQEEGLKNIKHKAVKINNKSGYIGVCYLDKKKVFRATATFNKQEVRLGFFKDIKDAIITRYEWEVKTFGKLRKPDSKDDYLKSIGYI